MNERIKILEMLQKGIITVEEAEKLLRAVDENIVEVPSQQINAKSLNIDISSSDGDIVNVKLPLNLLRLFKGKKINIGNGKVNEVVDQLDFDSLLEMVENGAMGEIVNINSADGDKVIINVK